MKIRAQVNAMLLLAALVSAAAVGVTLAFSHDLELATRDIRNAEDLIDNATQLRQIGVEAALFHEPRAQDQWQRKLVSMRESLDGMPLSAPAEQAQLRSIGKKMELLDTIYARLDVAPAVGAGSATSLAAKLDASGEARTVASLLVVTQEVVDIGHSLIRSYRADRALAQRNLQLSVLWVILTMGAVVVFVWHLVNRRILRPMRTFEEGTQQVAAGNYAHRLNLSLPNEVGALAHAFDSMTARVEQTTQDITAHRDTLTALVSAKTAELSNARDRAETISQYARSLIEASLDPLVTINAHGKITDVNEASVQATGVSREELVGTDFSDYFTEPAMARIGYQRVFSEGLVRDYPLAIRHTSGAVMDVLYNAVVYKDAQGRAVGVFAAARDITARKQLDLVLRDNTAQLQQAMALAEKASLAKSEFLSSMSHELRTPLNAILGFAQLIDSDINPPTAAQKRSLSQIIKGGWYLLELINEILDLAQVESGKVQLSLEPVALADVILESRAMIEPQAEQRGIGLVFAPMTAPYFVNADRTRLKQILINLLSNAVKYNRPGGTVAVEFDLLPHDAIRISVRDTGAGLTPEQTAQLFQPFNRLGKEAGVEEGTGIGLVVTRRLAEMMGGTIGVQSTVGVGSVFWTDFPLTPDPSGPGGPGDTTRNALLAEPTPPSANTGARQRSLLYVEDNAANLDLVAQLITRRADLRFLSAPDATIGIEFANSHLPDIILMDIHLPGISGIDAMKILRANPLTAHIPIIALTANALPRDLKNGRAAGFFDYLTKPIKIPEFMDTVNKALQFSVDAAAQRRD